jgi:hypothetical protein
MQCDDYITLSVKAIEYVIDNYFSDRKSVRLVEVGPFSVSVSDVLRTEHEAPIKKFHVLNPDIKCCAYGPKVYESKEDIIRTVGDVEYVEGYLTIERSHDKNVKRLIDMLGGRPNIIFGQHTFEGSDSSFRDHPFGPYKLFEKASEILADGGFIIAQNYGGKLSNVGRQGHWQNSKLMKNEVFLIYSEDEGINVLKKY